MKVFQGVAITDGRNRNNTEFKLNALVSAYNEAWNKPIPMHIGHDRTKPVGYAHIKGIYLEPGKAYVTNNSCLIETEEERKQLIKLISNYDYHIFCKNHKEEIKKLVNELGDKIENDYFVTPVGQAVAISNNNIVKRACPELSNDIEDGLIDLRKLEPVYKKIGNKNILVPGIYQMGKYLLFAHRFFRRNLSILNTTNSLFFEKFEKMRSNIKLDLQVALDMDMIGLYGTEMLESEYQYQRGPHFNEDLSKIPTGVTCHENTYYDNLFSNLISTQFYWHNQDGRKSFECEELCDRENISLDNGKTMLWGCKYVHSMLNPNSGLPTHLDGAVRIYNEEQIIERIDNRTDISKCEKSSDYKKLWRIDNDFSITDWKEIISLYYRDNLLIEEYFGGIDDNYNQIIKNKEEKNRRDNNHLFDYLELEKDDGLRIFLNYSQRQELAEDRDIKIINNDFLTYQKIKKIKIIDSESITFLKLLKRKGISLRIPFTTLVEFGDMIYNFPTIFCKDADVLNVVMEAIKELCKAWTNRGDDRLVSVGVMINQEDRAAHISFAGHVNDFVNFFNNNYKPLEASIEEWVSNMYAINNIFKKANNNPNIFSLIHGDRLVFKRIIIDPKLIDKTWIEKDIFNIRLKINDEKIDYLQRHRITASPFFIVKENKCLKCGKSYIKCDCIKFIDEDVIDEPITIEKKGFIWTNRNASFPKEKLKISKPK